MKIIVFAAATLAGLALLILAAVLATRESHRWREWKRKEAPDA